MRKLALNSLLVTAIALATTVGRDAQAADLVVPPAPSTLNTMKLVSNACSKCHGATGISISPLFPILAAQQSTYIDTELKLFRQRGRSDPHARAFMWGIARGLTDDQIDGVAQYFSSQPAVSGSASRDPALAEKGKAIFENGVPAREIPGCTICHGPNAAGIAAFPRLAGQHRDYLTIQLRQFRNQMRESEIMQPIAKGLTDDEIAAVVEYVASK
jgi:cytochrome c553